MNIWIINCKNIYSPKNKSWLKTPYLCLVCLFLILALSHCQINTPPEEDIPPEHPKTDTPSKDESVYQQPKQFMNDLDKISSEKPSTVKQLTFQEIQSMPVEEIAHAGETGVFPFSDVSNWTLSILSPEQLNQVVQVLHSYDELYRIKPPQLRSLSSNHVQAIQHHLKNFSSGHTKIWTPEQLTGIQLSRFPPKHISSLSFEHLSMMTLDLNINEILPLISFELFTKAVQNTLFRSLTCSQIQSITEKQIIQYGIILFTTDQISCLTPRHIAMIPLDGIIYIQPPQLAVMSDEQLKAISIEKSHQFLDDHLRALSLPQFLLFKDNPQIESIIDFITNESEFFNTATAESISNQEYYIQFLPPDSFDNVSYEQALSFSDDLLTNLTIERIAKTPHYFRVLIQRPHLAESLTAEKIQVIPLEAIPLFTSEFLIRLTDKQAGSFTPTQLSAMTPAQMKNLLLSRFKPDTLSLEKTIAVVETSRASEQAQDMISFIKDVQSEHCEQIYSNNERLKLNCIKKWSDFFSFVESTQEDRQNKCLQYKIQHDQTFNNIEGMEFNLKWCLKGLYTSAH